MRAVIMLVFVLAINMLLFFAQLGIDEVNPESPNKVFDYKDSMMKDYDSGNYDIKEFSSEDMFDDSSDLNVNENIFTDLFTTIKNWIFSIPGLKYIVAIIGAVPNFCKAIGLQKEITFAIGFFWYSLVVFVFISFAKGGS